MGGASSPEKSCSASARSRAPKRIVARAGRMCASRTDSTSLTRTRPYRKTRAVLPCDFDERRVVRTAGAADFPHDDGKLPRPNHAADLAQDVPGAGGGAARTGAETHEGAVFPLVRRRSPVVVRVARPHVAQHGADARGCDVRIDGLVDLNRDRQHAAAQTGHLLDGELAARIGVFAGGDVQFAQEGLIGAFGAFHMAGGAHAHFDAVTARGPQAELSVEGCDAGDVGFADARFLREIGQSFGGKIVVGVLQGLQKGDQMGPIGSPFFYCAVYGFPGHRWISLMVHQRSI
jgi:hypothetical protein